ncbi:HAMP domain-containing sensor histidine kinase [Clostridium folliculivorans]|uniref:histidine kinase n=1 Tax=Clostridium folliculivorans TaxID=2886038 RepID=A0A9W5Y5I6_9CLOT|nr:HAMP domain-containing sensor histidine kinase [Clostridium folliculivorans]GKU27114.1 two-component sensor histidine kinase [Clostridium folliculivorans]GKU31731.1 two-component sensor histidine kinase [Clostridium folliculivorans]
MKTIKRKRKPKSIYLKIMLGYFIFGVVTIVLLFTLIIALAFFTLFSARRHNENDFPKSTAKAIVCSDYKKIDSAYIEKNGGWVEILKDNKVVFVKGDKKDNINEYTEDQLINYTSTDLKSSFDFNRVTYSAAAFKGQDGNNYICLVKFPPKNGEMTFGGQMSGSPLEKEIEMFTTSIFSGAALILLIIMFILSKIVAKQISNPIKHIVKGIQTISTGEYDYRIKCKADSELAMIRDALNDMSKRIQEAEAQKKLAEESKRMIIADISHDLKTPITSIQGYARALNDGLVVEEEKKKKYLNYIYEKSNRMNYLIDELFTFSKMDTPSYKLNLVEGDLANFFRENIIGFIPDFEKCNFNYNVDVRDEYIRYRFDRDELYRAISNIIINALKYNPPGTSLNFFLIKEEDRITMSIEDDGIGISEEVRKTIFNEFTRGDSARRSDGGSGLGMAITKKVIELHGGNIGIESELGKGTKFIINLPTINYNN